MSISKEERDIWRQRINNGELWDANLTGAVLRLLDALEQAEAELDALARALDENSIPCPDGSREYCGEEQRGEKNCKDCWLAWARAEAAKRVEEEV